MVNRVRPGVKALLAVMAVTAIGVSMIVRLGAASTTRRATRRAGATTSRPTTSTPSSMFQDPLPIPNRLTPTYTDTDQRDDRAAGTPVWVVHARSYTWRPADGVCIDKWGFEGTTPGPTLVAAPARGVRTARLQRAAGQPLQPVRRPVQPAGVAAGHRPEPHALHGVRPVADRAARTVRRGAVRPDPVRAEPRRSPSTCTVATRRRRTTDTRWTRSAPDSRTCTTIRTTRKRRRCGTTTTRWITREGTSSTGSPASTSSRIPPPTRRSACRRASECTSVPSIAPTAEPSPPYWPTPDPVPVDPEQPTACDDIPIMFQQVPAEMLSGQEFQPNAIAAPTDPANTPYRAVWTVNGTLAPYLTVTNKPYRFRFLNGNDEEPLQIWTTTDADDPTSYSSDAYLQQVGTDGGLMNSVVVADPPSQTRIQLFPAQRADVVIDFSKITTTDDDLPAEQLAAGIRRRDVTVVPDRPVRSSATTSTRPPCPSIKFVVEPTTPAADQLRSARRAATQQRNVEPDHQGSRRRRPTAGPCPNGRCCSASTERSAGTRSPPSTRSSSTHSRRRPSPSSAPPRSGT